MQQGCVAGWVVLPNQREQAAVTQPEAARTASAKPTRPTSPTPVWPRLRHHARCGHVGQQHELLNQLVGLLLRQRKWNDNRFIARAQGEQQLPNTAHPSASSPPAACTGRRALLATAMGVQHAEQARVVSSSCCPEQHAASMQNSVKSAKLHSLSFTKRKKDEKARLLVHAVVAWVAIPVQFEEQARVVQAQGAAVKAPLAQRRGDAVQGEGVADHLRLSQQVHTN